MSAMPSSKLLIVGLGNYTHPLTRHSIGQLALDNLHRYLNCIHRATLDLPQTNVVQHKSIESAPITIRSEQTRSEISDGLVLSKMDTGWVSRHRLNISREGTLAKQEQTLEIHLLRPKVLMNLSGSVVVPVYNRLLKTDPSRTALLLIYDELDLKPLSVRLKHPPRSSKSKGHNGLKSTIAHLSKQSLARLYTLAIGIGRDPDSKNCRDSEHIGRWVLGALNGNDIKACTWDEDRQGLFQNRGTDQSGTVITEIWQNIIQVIDVASSVKN